MHRLSELRDQGDGVSHSIQDAQADRVAAPRTAHAVSLTSKHGVHPASRRAPATHGLPEDGTGTESRAIARAQNGAAVATRFLIWFRHEVMQRAEK